MANTIGKAAVAAATAILISVAAPASAATIVLNDTGGVNDGPAKRGFQTAALYWARQLSNNVTINLDISFAPLDPRVLGSTGSRTFVVSAAGLYAQLAGSATSALDASAVSSLQPLNGSGALTAIIPGYVVPATKGGVDTTSTIIDNDNSSNNRFIVGTSANLKALNYVGFPPGADATIRFNSNFAFDYDPTDGITPGTFDFTGVAIHEIGHALGFTSGADTYDFLGCPSGPACGDNRNFNNFAIATVADLFRYSAEDTLNWAPGQETYFSIDGGVSELLGDANLSTGRYNGDGYQASHFKANGTCDDFIGIMNPYLCSGTLGEITAQDLGVFDAIGWQTSVNVLRNPGYNITSADAFSVPEPMTWIQLLLGFFAIGGALRSSRRGRRARTLVAA